MPDSRKIRTISELSFLIILRRPDWNVEVIRLGLYFEGKQPLDAAGYRGQDPYWTTGQ